MLESDRNRSSTRELHFSTFSSLSSSFRKLEAVKRKESRASRTLKEGEEFHSIAALIDAHYGREFWLLCQGRSAVTFKTLEDTVGQTTI